MKICNKKHILYIKTFHTNKELKIKNVLNNKSRCSYPSNKLKITWSKLSINSFN